MHTEEGPVARVRFARADGLLMFGLVRCHDGTGGGGHGRHR